MIKLISFVIVISMTAYIAQKSWKVYSMTGNKSAKIQYQIITGIILIGFILFTGLRSKYNDTGTYMEGFKYFVGEFKFSIKNLLTESYSGFEMFQSFIKTYIGDEKCMIMLSAVIIQSIYLWMFKKHSEKYSGIYCMVIICYFIVGTFVLSTAAIKQMMCMSFSVLAIEELLKKKYVKYIMFLFIAYTFHPYVLVTLIVPFLMGDAWSKKMIYITILAVAGSFMFTQFLGVILNMAETVGKSYSVEEMTDHTISPLRVIADGIPVVMTFIFRKQINQTNDQFLKLATNMMVVSGLLTFASLFGNPIYIYRTGQYFASYKPIVIAWMMIYCLPKNKALNYVIIAGFVAIYFWAFIATNYKWDISYDPYKHITILQFVDGLKLFK